jgi:magnesium chelatase family protein
LDFADVVDQEVAKRAFVIAAAGEHGLLMVGPPGAGKSMMAKRMPTILAPMDEKEQAEALIIHSVAGQDLAPLLGGARPFRAPHHAVSFGGMVGGGRPVRPGEISLAHKGVLFLDELPEFGPSVLQALRQPMEEREVRIVRVDGTYIFPCDFMLVAAANPCPCGYLGDPDHHCTCSASRIQTYQSRIGGPLMDRIDVLVDVARPDSSRIISGEEGLSSEQMAEQVAVARGFASWRRERSDDKPDRTRNVPELGLDAQARASLEGVANRLGLGGRNIVRIARVARTIADLAESEEVKRDHVMEACAYRTRATL